MNSSSVSAGAFAAALGLAIASPGAAEPQRWHEYHEHHGRHYPTQGHGDCLRFNKTTGTIAGAGVGGLLGHAVIGGTGGALVGAAGGGLAGHELARNGRKHC